MEGNNSNALLMKFGKWVGISLITVYAVILAGAMVRMTGSGMGCPDWPKCFGYYIPPTDVEQLTWKPGKTFESGQVIIKDEALWVAKHDTQASETFNYNDWREYTKHDYAIFNPMHTWIEYINRLCGAISGFTVLFMAFLSIKFLKSRPRLFWLAWLSVFLMGFQAWLGATVVYSVLNPLRITLHMLVALVIVALLIYLKYQTKTHDTQISSKGFKVAALSSIVLSLIQVASGTQLRQFVDVKVKEFGYDNMHQILNDPTFVFYFHRSFSILVFALAFWMWKENKKRNFGFNQVNWIFGFILFEVATGIAMAYFDFPFGSQAIHLLIASILFGFQYDLYLKTSQKPS